MVVDGANSDWLPVLSGVPQGSILGPMLFLCYINDMPSSTQNSTIALFADDSKCFRTIQDTNDCLLLQRDIDSLYNWGKRWDLHYHPSKCQIICMSRRKDIVNFDYKMNGAVLGRTDSIKDLGIDITYNLVWNQNGAQVIEITVYCQGRVKTARTKLDDQYKVH